MAAVSSSGPGATRVKPGTVEINADRAPDERAELVFVNTADRPIQIGSHIHLPDGTAQISIFGGRNRMEEPQARGSAALESSQYDGSVAA